jgi:hypothetical protein
MVQLEVLLTIPSNDHSLLISANPNRPLIPVAVEYRPVAQFRKRCDVCTEEEIQSRMVKFL